MKRLEPDDHGGAGIEQRVGVEVATPNGFGPCTISPPSTRPSAISDDAGITNSQRGL